MNRADAEALVIVMDAAWPRGGWLDEQGELTPRGEMYARDLERYSTTAGAVAVEALRKAVRWGEGPSPAELLEALRAAQRDEDMPTFAALPGPDLAALAPDEQTKQLLDRYWEGVGVEKRGRLRVQRAARLGDTEAKVEAGRLLAAAQIEAEEDRRTVPERSERSPAGNSACGAAWGTRAVERDGVYVCPRCGSPISEGCAVQREEASA